MKGFTSAVIVGTLGRDPEIRATPQGKKVANLSLAVETGPKDNAKTHWFNVVCWEKLADLADSYMKKGKTILVSGHLNTKSWPDKQTGATRTVVELVADEIQFMDGDRKQDSGGGRSAPPARRETAAPTPRATAPADPDPFADDEIPF